jgi:hypothetical protein
MLIDAFLPNYDAVERHQITIAAQPSLVFACVWTADLGSPLIIRILLALRRLPACLAHPATGLQRLRLLSPSSGLTLPSLLDAGFCLLAQEPDREILLGLVGQFWTVSGNIEPTDPERFRRPLRGGTARAAWNFTIEACAPGQTILRTETRVHCSDPRTAARFRCYWLVIRPFSGLIRRLMLGSIARACRRAAEQADAPGPAQ